MNVAAGRPELRDGRTIRAYLDELMRLKLPVRMAKAGADARPFTTTLESVRASTFTVATIPPLDPGQAVTLGFLLDNRWLTTSVRVEGTGVFSLPTYITHGERRAVPRGAFADDEAVEALLVERVQGTFLGGRLLRGRVLDLSTQGLRLRIDEGMALTGPPVPVGPGDTFDLAVITGLPFLPPVPARAVLVHRQARPGEPSVAGFRLEGLAPLDRQGLERILNRRLPATYGRSFPARKLKTDIADRPGVPTPEQVKPRLPEVVALPPDPEEDDLLALEDPRVAPAIRLRKLGRKVLVMSSEIEAAARLVEDLRWDGYRHTYLARDPAQARDLAGQHRFDLVLVDLKVGGFWGHGLLGNLRNKGLLTGVPVILVTGHANALAEEAALELGAVYIHERHMGYRALAPVLSDWLLRP